MASLGLLTSMLGFTDADCALMIALYIAMDSFGTACNVTGDGAIAIAVARIFGKNKQGVIRFYGLRIPNPYLYFLRSVI